MEMSTRREAGKYKLLYHRRISARSVLYLLVCASLIFTLLPNFTQAEAFNLAYVRANAGWTYDWYTDTYDDVYHYGWGFLKSGGITSEDGIQGAGTPPVKDITFYDSYDVKRQARNIPNGGVVNKVWYFRPGASGSGKQLIDISALGPPNADLDISVTYDVTGTKEGAGTWEVNVMATNDDPSKTLRVVWFQAVIPKEWIANQSQYITASIDSVEQTISPIYGNWTLSYDPGNAKAPVYGWERGWYVSLFKENLGVSQAVTFTIVVDLQSGITAVQAGWTPKSTLTSLVTYQDGYAAASAEQFAIPNLEVDDVGYAVCRLYGSPEIHYMSIHEQVYRVTLPDPPVPDGSAPDGAGGGGKPSKSHKVKGDSAILIVKSDGSIKHKVVPADSMSNTHVFIEGEL